jgi:uncharacterized protein YcfL
MHRTYHNFCSSAVKLFLVSISLCAVIGCDSVLPEKFKEKNINPQDIDLRAGRLLASDTVNTAQGITVGYQYGSVLDSAGVPKQDSSGNPIYRVLPVTWSVVSSRTLGSFTTLPSGTDNQFINSNFGLLTDSLPSLNSDSLISISYSETQTTSYAVLKASQAENIYIYTGLYYYLGASTSNTNDYVSVDLVNKDTSVVGTSSSIPQESSYGSTETILNAQNTTVVSVIRARYTFHVDQGGVYLVRFTLSNPKEISNQQAPASGLPTIADKFKVVILSF